MITFDIIQSVIDAIGPLELYVSLCSCWIFIFCIFFLSESPLLSSKAKGRILPSPSLMPIITSFKEIKRANFCTLVSVRSLCTAIFARCCLQYSIFVFSFFFCFYSAVFFSPFLLEWLLFFYVIIFSLYSVFLVLLGFRWIR